jgi:hypothetical protein
LTYRERPAGARDHGGGVDAAAARWGGAPADWLDFSTGINPVPYPLPPLVPEAWTLLPDRGAEAALASAAPALCGLPETAAALSIVGD